MELVNIQLEIKIIEFLYLTEDIKEDILNQFRRLFGIKYFIN
jgi:hypothetical protein